MEWAKVKAERLLLLAGVVWSAAGSMVLSTGIATVPDDPQAGAMLASLVGALAVFGAFHRFVFSGLVVRHSARIAEMGDARAYFWRFFDAKGYAMMATMMGGGAIMRSAGIMPPWLVVPFYAGIGAALLLSGMSFLARFALKRPIACPFAS